MDIRDEERMPEYYQVLNLSNKITVATEVKIAASFWTRLKGLIGKKGLNKEEGLLITPCNIIHTWGMNFSIDVLFLSVSNEVVYILEHIPPNKVSPYIKKAAFVIELPAGRIAECRCKVGDTIEIA